MDDVTMLCLGIVVGRGVVWPVFWSTGLLVLFTFLYVEWVGGVGGWVGGWVWMLTIGVVVCGLIKQLLLKQRIWKGWI
jgi:hypothetical protein